MDVAGSRNAALSPVVIGGTGGSGTRVVVEMLQALGVPMGQDLGKAKDALLFVPFVKRWLKRSLLDRSGQRPLAGFQRSRMMGALRRTVEGLRRDAHPDDDSLWGWKSPRTIFFLPMLNQYMPDMRYIHVVRDPRDMAFSKNQLQLVDLGDLFLTGDERAEPEPVRSAIFWKKVNNEASVVGSSMGDRYLRVRYEGLCLNPHGSVERLAAFLSLSVRAEDVERAAAVVTPPASLGRWKTQDPTTVEQIHAHVRDELQRYGYEDDRHPIAP